MSLKKNKIENSFESKLKMEESSKTSSDSFEIFQLSGSGFLDDEVMDCNGKYEVVPNETHNGRAVYGKKNRVVRFTAAERWAIMRSTDNIILVFNKYKDAKIPSDVKKWMVLNENFELVDASNRFFRIRELSSRIANRGDLKCLQTLDLVLKYLIRNPDVEKYKFLKSSNKRFSKEILSVEDAIELLRTIGFRHTSYPEEGFRYDVNEPIKCVSMIRDIVVDAGQRVDANKISTVYCDVCNKARIVKRFEVDARVFQEKDFPWQCKDLRRIGSCSRPDDELLKCAHDSTAFALVLESLGIRTRALLATQSPESLYNKISKVSTACTLCSSVYYYSLHLISNIISLCFCVSYLHSNHNTLEHIGTLPLCQATVMKARHGEITDTMDHILADCSEQTKRVLVQCEILTPKRLLSWKASALAGMLRTQSTWKDGEAPTGLDVEKWQETAKSCIESTHWLNEHQYLPIINEGV